MRIDADGPALRLRRPAKAAVWYPLARLARVVSSGMVAWEAEALLACAEAGVPVVFLRRDGSVRAYLSGGGARLRDPHDLLYTRLRARLNRPGGMRRYGDWRRAMTGAALRALGVQLGQRLDGKFRDGCCGRRWRRLGGAMSDRPRRLIDDRLHGLRAGLSAELLAGGRIGCSPMGEAGRGADLPAIWPICWAGAGGAVAGGGGAAVSRRASARFVGRGATDRLVPRSTRRTCGGWAGRAASVAAVVGDGVMTRKRRLYLILRHCRGPAAVESGARYSGKFAFRVQYSVFVGSFFEHSLAGVLHGLEGIIDPRRTMCAAIRYRNRRRWCCSARNCFPTIFC